MAVLTGITWSSLSNNLAEQKAKPRAGAPAGRGPGSGLQWGVPSGMGLVELVKQTEMLWQEGKEEEAKDKGRVEGSWVL